MNIRAQRRELVDMMYMCESVDMANTAQIAEKAKAFIDYFKDKPPSHLLASYGHMFNSILASAVFYIPIAVEHGVFDKDLMQDLLATAIQHGENPFQRDWYPDDFEDNCNRCLYLELAKLKLLDIDADATLKMACKLYGVSWEMVESIFTRGLQEESIEAQGILREPDVGVVPAPPGYQLTVVDDCKRSLVINSFYGEDLDEVWNRAFYTSIQRTTTNRSYPIIAATNYKGELELAELSGDITIFEVSQLNSIADALVNELNRNAEALNLDILYTVQLIRIGEF